MGKALCFFCNKKCRGDVLKVGEKYFHKECFTCKVCHCKLEDVAFFCKSNSFYCASDYKIYCASECYLCHKKIIGEVVSALSRTFHKECFICSKCQNQFASGDKVSLRGGDFFCSACLAVITGTIPTKINHSATLPNNIKHNNNNNINGTNNNSYNLESIPAKELFQNKSQTLSNSISTNQQIASVPTRRKQVSTSSSTSPMTNEITAPIKSQLYNQNQDTLSRTTSNSMIPKHFHIPPSANDGRSWVNSPSIVGSKTHPLALSTSHLSHISRTDGTSDYPTVTGIKSSAATHISFSANSTPEKHFPDKSKGELIKRLASYPSGHEQHDHSRIDREDFPAPAAHAVLVNEKNRKRIQNPTVEALSAGTTPRIGKTKSMNPSQERNHINLHSIKRSTTDSATYPRNHISHLQPDEVPHNPISASRCPSASCEPLVPPRYQVHLETSPSRNDEYFRSSQRHLGYSMEFINSTNRSFLNDNNSTTGSTNVAFRHSYDPRLIPNELNGLKRVRLSSNESQKYKSMTIPLNLNDSTRQNDDNTEMKRRSTSSHTTKTIPYHQLRISSIKTLKYLDRTKLEAYLSDEEFLKVFHLNRVSFYRLPEWKRNDLKKRVDLF